ncbi:hypothetical protein H7097_00845 [Aeromicrobium sp.]|nr:hypothetical protein [Candidatus Saccharibacteria bacterium]
MINFNNPIRLTVAAPLVAGIMMLAPASVYAARSSDTSSTNGTSQSPESISGSSNPLNTSGRDATTLSEQESNDAVGTQDAVDDNDAAPIKIMPGDSLKNRAAKLLADKRQTGKQRTTEQRQKACQARETGIDTRLDALGTRAQRHLDAFNSLFSKVQTYQTTAQLEVSNFDSLVADTTAKQATATAATAALSSLAGTKIDCASPDPASTLANVKVATTDARTSLQAYRASLKTLVKTLLTAKATAETNDGGTQ